MAARIILIALGIFAICGVIFKWDIFFKNYRARIVRRLLGEKGTLIFYIGAGVFLIAYALFMR